MTRGALALAGIGVALVACGPSQEKREARAVLASIEKLRDAPESANRAELAAALAKMPAKLEAARRARDACADGYGRMVEARTLLDKAAAAQSEEGAGAEGLAAFANATAALDAAEKAMPRCDEAEADLARALR